MSSEYEDKTKRIKGMTNLEFRVHEIINDMDVCKYYIDNYIMRDTVISEYQKLNELKEELTKIKSSHSEYFI
jgi:hypothetical protein